MGRQKRAEKTRRKIIDAAVDLFDEIGYASTGLGDIIERADITKGALYYHFDSKDALAAALIEEATANVLGTFADIGESSSPALENVIHGLLAVGRLVRGDKVTRTGRHLARGLSQVSEAGADTYRRYTAVIVAQVEKAAAEGDVRADVDHAAVADTIVAAMIGAEALSTAVSRGEDLLDRMSRSWEVLLPGIISEESLPYFREFLARESVRHTQPELSFE